MEIYMRLTIVFAIVLSFIVGCSNSSSPEKNYKTGPWNGLFGLQKGLTKEQIGNYTSLAEIGSEKQNFAGATLPIDYGVKFDSIIYTINSIEGLCAISLVIKNDNDLAIVRNKIEEFYGNSTIERPGQYATWDKQNVSPSAVIAINYAYNDNLIKIFYDNYDRCKLP